MRGMGFCAYETQLDRTAEAGRCCSLLVGPPVLTGTSEREIRGRVAGF
jgi:hypothetical protein